MNSFTKDLMYELLSQKEEYIKAALIELVSRGLIEIEETQPTVIQTQNIDKIEFKLVQSIRLVPKEFDYIKKLEAENKELKERLDKIKELL